MTAWTGRRRIVTVPFSSDVPSLPALARLRGRDEELALLGDQVARLQSGRGSQTLIVGAGGTGRTRLLEEAGVIARRVGAVVGRAAAHPGDSAVPLHLLMSALCSGADPVLDR